MNSRKTKQKAKLRILTYFIIILTFILVGYLFSEHNGKVIYEVKEANVIRVIDGDTLEIDTGKVRLLGINTPEKRQYYHDEAKNFLKGLEGKEVKLEIREKDIFGRLLAYVFYQDRFINHEILEKGFGHYFSYHEDKYTRKLKKAESEAREKEIGVWKRSQEKCASCIVLSELNYKGPNEYVLLENKCNFDCPMYGWTVKDSVTHIKKLSFNINAGKQKHVYFEGRIWNDDGDTLYLRDSEGLLVLFYRY
jgi:endonuclease YncB( thermonuclease family)